MGRETYLPPWRDVLEDGSLSEPYGPRTLSTYQNHCSKSKDWAFRKPRKERAEAKLVHEYARAHHSDMGESMLEVYRLIYVREQGHAFQ